MDQPDGSRGIPVLSTYSYEGPPYVQLIEAQPAARIDYVEFFDPLTLEPVTNLKPGTHMALAVFVGQTRLIDNARLG